MVDVMDDSLGQIFLQFSIAKLRQYSSEIGRCLGQLSDEQIWRRGSANENAIGNLVLHLCGNVSQRIGAIAGRPDTRDRPSEFSAIAGHGSNEIAAFMQTTVDDAISVLSEIPTARLSDRVITGEFNQTILESIYHMETHFALHSGQIFYATKNLTGRDLGFYKPPVAEKNAGAGNGKSQS